MLVEKRIVTNTIRTRISRFIHSESTPHTPPEQSNIPRTLQATHIRNQNHSPFTHHKNNSFHHLFRFSHFNLKLVSSPTTFYCIAHIGTHFHLIFFAIQYADATHPTTNPSRDSVHITVFIAAICIGSTCIAVHRAVTSISIISTKSSIHYNNTPQQK